MEGKIIIGLIFIFSTTISQAQKNKFISPDWEQENHSFALPELQIDSTFIANLNTKLFDKECGWWKSKKKNNKSSRHFHIYFEKEDSLTYCINIDLWNIPAKNSAGFFEYNGYLYWFGNDAPPDIILEEKSKKRFSYKEPIPAPYDPPLWILMYNSQTSNIEVKERYCY